MHRLPSVNTKAFGISTFHTPTISADATISANATISSYLQAFVFSTALYTIKCTYKCRTRPVFEMQGSIQFSPESSVLLCRQGKSRLMYDYHLQHHRLHLRRLRLLHLRNYLPQLVHTAVLHIRRMRQLHPQSHHSSLTRFFVLCSAHLLLQLPHPR